MNTPELYAVLLDAFRHHGVRGTGRLLGDVYPNNAYAMRASRTLASLDAFRRSHFGFVLQLAKAFGYRVDFTLPLSCSQRPH